MGRNIGVLGFERVKVTFKLCVGLFFPILERKKTWFTQEKLSFPSQEKTKVQGSFLMKSQHFRTMEIRQKYGKLVHCDINSVRG